MLTFSISQVLSFVYFLNRNCVKIKDLFEKNDDKMISGVDYKQMKSITDKSFAEKLNNTLRNDSKIFNNPNIKLNKTTDNPLIASKKVVSVKESPLPNSHQNKVSLCSEPNPLPKPPRTFAHDVYLELKFSAKNTNNNNITENSDQNSVPIYSQPNKANKKKNRLRSQSDSQVIETKKSNEFKSNENIYDDCITTRSVDKTLKSKLLQFSCLKFKH